MKKDVVKKQPIILPLHKACILLFVLLSIHPSANAQPALIVGIDHVGITVPDMDQAVQFFSDVFGFTPVTSIGPFQVDDAWRKKFRLHPGSEVEKIVMMRAGNGANIELFKFKSSKANNTQPFQDDAGWHHIALYTVDMKKSIKYLKSKGVTIIHDPIEVTSGPTAGESWAYFLAPWGTQMELNSYPVGKQYETEAAVRLWSPKDNISPNQTQRMDTTDAKFSDVDLIKKHLSIWSERNPEKRKSLIEETYVEQVHIIDPFFEFTGRGELDKFIRELQVKNPGYAFTLAKPIEIHHGIGRLFWLFGPSSKPDTVSGQDIFVLKNGKIETLFVFIDGLPSH